MLNTSGRCNTMSLFSLRLVQSFIVFQSILFVICCVLVPVPPIQSIAPTLSLEVWRETLAQKEKELRVREDIEFDRNETIQSMWLSRAPCPGRKFSAAAGKCVPFAERDFPDECAIGGIADLDVNTSKWILMAGDSNMRQVYTRIQPKLAPSKGGGVNQFDDREAFDSSSGLRFSFRFIDYREQSKGCEHCNASTRFDTMLDNLTLSHDHNGKAFPLPKVALSKERPDAVILNTGLWEVMRMNDTEWKSMRPKLKSRTRALFQRWKAERISEKLVWITTPSARPKDELRKNNMKRDRLRWLGAMEVKMLLEEVGTSIFYRSANGEVFCQIL